MSTQKRISWDQEGQPVLVVTVYGWCDVFRFGWAMAHLQCDFSVVGRSIGASLKRRLGAKRFAAANYSFTSGGATWAHYPHDQYGASQDDEELPAQ